MSFGNHKSISIRGINDKSIMYHPDAIRRRKQRMIDHSALNYQMIIDNAMLTNLRTLKLNKGNFSKIYEFDVIVPKSHRANEVCLVIENEAEKMSVSQHKEHKNHEKHREEEYNELEEIIEKIDENEPILDKIRFKGNKFQGELNTKNHRNLDVSKAVDIQPNKFFTNPIVYPCVSALFNDIRFKTLSDIKPKHMITQNNFQQIDNFADVKRGEIVFITDAFTMNK